MQRLELLVVVPLLVVLRWRCGVVVVLPRHLNMIIIVSALLLVYYSQFIRWVHDFV